MHDHRRRAAEGRLSIRWNLSDHHRGNFCRGEELKTTTARRTVTRFPRIAPWVWGFLLTGIIQIIGGAFVTGTVMQKLNDLVTRTDYIEHRIDVIAAPEENQGPRR